MLVTALTNSLHSLAEFKDVLFRIDFFERRNALMSNSEVVSAATTHYIRQVLKQFYVIVLGLDVIGNPVGLVLGFGQGVGDFFYEPFLGIIEGPEEFAEGLALGVRSLFSHTLGGAAGALSKITGTLGEGVSALTMDDEYIARRRARMNQQTNVAQSGKELARGFFSGITGIITKPIQGARQTGVEGFVKGIGKGAVGVIAQPATGVIDFASGSLGALKKAVDIQAETKKLRPTRVFHPDNVLRPYNRYEASGAELLKQADKGAYAKTDHYIAHGMLRHENNGYAEMTIMVTTRRVLLLKQGSLFKSIDVEWMQPYENIAGVDLLDGKIQIVLKVSAEPALYTRFTKLLLQEDQKFLGIINDGKKRYIFFQTQEIANVSNGG